MVSVVELRKMATKQKIEGRSKMNKAQLEKALGMSSSKASPKKAAKKVTKKTTVSKCKGGVCKKVSSPKVNKNFASEAINDALKELHPGMKFNDAALKYIIDIDTSKLSLNLFMDLVELSGNEAQLHDRKVISLKDVKVTIKDDSKLSKLL